MTTHTAVGVDDDLAAGEAGVAVRTTDDELAGGVDVPDGVLGDPALGQRLLHIGLHDLEDLGRGEAFIRVLMTIAINAWVETSACTGDCNQGRNCTCMRKKDENV